MNKTYRSAGLAVMLLLGGATVVSLMLTGVACQTPSGGGQVEDHREIGDQSAVVAGESVYKMVAFDHKLHEAAVDGECTSCHHPEPDSANQACHMCHSRLEGRFSKKFNAFVPRLKDVMHNPDSGCRACHDDTDDEGLWQCKVCHTALN